MRMSRWAKACVLAGALCSAGLFATSARAASGCLTISASAPRVALTTFSFGPFNVTLNAGDVITLSDTAGAGPTDTLTVGSTSLTFGLPGSRSITIATTGSYTVTASGTVPAITGGTATLSCSPGPESSASAVQQSANNAQIAVSNGLRTVQNYQEWVTKGVLGSFGMTRGGDTAFVKPAVQPAPSRAVALAREERDLNEELAALPADDERRTRIDADLTAVRRRLTFARVTADLSALDGSTRPVSVRGTGAADTPRESTEAALPSAFSLDACDLAVCDGADPLSRKWNMWMEGRVAGLNDSLAQTNTLGFAGAAGVDYKFLPWLALGMRVGGGTSETRFGLPGVRTGTIGVSMVPYFGMRLHENVYAEGFVGLTKLNYNLNPAINVSGGFDAWRVFLGGALSGVWHDGGWRFQPSIMGAWGSETQNAYTDSASTAVPSQTITFGRIAAGPEIGYTFKDVSRGWTFEPFAILKGNIDFSSAPVYSIAGTPVVVRSGAQGSGQLGGGLAMQLDDGFYLRVQASYDSLFVTGLDAWSGRIRAGKTF